jgi:hypothetical protein
MVDSTKSEGGALKASDSYNPAMDGDIYSLPLGAVISAHHGEP